MAETYYINMAFHNPKGPVATAASIHVAASIPNFLILEHVSRIPVFDEIQIEPMTLGEGYYDLPTAPGLGVDLNEEVMAAYPYRYRPVLFASHEDGAPAHP
jgi:galactonate dehydratase